MAVHPLTYEYLSGRYTLTSAFPVCCRRAWYEARIHPSVRDPSAPRSRWLEKRFPKRASAGGVTINGQRHAAGAGRNHEQTRPCQLPELRKYSVRLVFRRLAMATPHEILSLHADREHPNHGFFPRGYDWPRSPG